MTCIATPLPVQGWAFGSVLATALPLLRPHGPSIAGGGPVCSVPLLRLRLLAGKLWQPACASSLTEFFLSDRVLVIPLRRLFIDPRASCTSSGGCGGGCRTSAARTVGPTLGLGSSASRPSCCPTRTMSTWSPSCPTRECGMAHPAQRCAAAVTGWLTVLHIAVAGTARTGCPSSTWWSSMRRSGPFSMRARQVRALPI